MHILLFASNFYPEIGSSSQIYLDLAKTFARYGNEVDVITSYPRVYTLPEELQDKTFPLYETIDGVHIHRVKHPSNRDNIIVRGLEHFYLPLYYFKAYKKLIKTGCSKIDACLLHTPPLPFYYLTRMVYRYNNVPSILNFEDYHPQELTDVGFLTNPLVISIMKHIEKKAYLNSAYITVHSPGGEEYVISRGADPKKVKTVYNSIDLKVVDDTTIPGDFKDEESVTDKFILTYAGILSPFQGLDTILNVAKQMRDNLEILFYIVGDGMEWTHLSERIKSENIHNVILRRFLPRENYLNLMKSTDVAIVSLDKRMKAPCLPGKFLNLLALERPILAIVAPESESAHLVSNAKCGIVINPNNTSEIVSAIYSLQKDKELCRNFGKNGKEFLLKHMTTDVVVKQYEEIVSELQK